MNRRRVIVAGGTAVLGWLAAAGGAAAFSASYEQQASTPEATLQSTVYIKDEQARIESQTQDGPVVMIKNAKGAYTYMPEEGVALLVKTPDRSQQPVAHFADYQDYLKQLGARRLRAETVNTYPCDVYQFKDGGQLTTAWVWKDKHLPVKIQTGDAVIELSNIRVNPPLADSLFQLPAGVQLMDMGAVVSGEAYGDVEDFPAGEPRAEGGAWDD